jgi:hypothetical protein
LNEPEVYLSAREYANLLNTVYPVIKQVSPNTIIIAGALMRPDNGWWELVNTFAPNSYDAISFHYYHRWPYVSISDTCKQAEYLAQFSDNVYLTETAIRCSGNCDAIFLQGQVSYFQSLYTSNCIDMFSWYTLANNYWDNTDMIYDSIKRPAWYEYERMLK